MGFTKLYLTAVAAPYSPATYRGAWDDTAGVGSFALSPQPEGGGGITSRNRAETSSDTEWDVLLYRGVSGPLAAQTIACNIDVIIGVRESFSSMDGYWHLHVYATQGDSDTPRGTLLSDYREAPGSGTEWPITAVGRALNSAQALSSLAIQSGDRLVVEIGYVARNSVTTSYTGSLWYGTELNNTPCSDLTVGGDGTSLAGFITFSETINEDDHVARVSHLAVDAASSIAVAPARVSHLMVDAASPNWGSAARVSHIFVDVASEYIPPVGGIVPVFDQYYRRMRQ